MAIFRHPLTCLLPVVVLVAGFGLTSYPLPPEEKASRPQSALTVDNETYIDANRILMFVTNHGNFGRDIAGIFGNDYGTYFPYTSIADINAGRTPSPFYAGGLWLGGVDSASGDTLVVVSEYSSEYVPGPMLNGTYQTDRPEFRVYKLYRDSLASNPNSDYLNWPVDQGAPVDRFGNPGILADHFLWAVCNDANQSRHTNNNGSTAPVGVEVHHSVFAWKRTSGIMATSVFLRFKLINKGTKTLKNTMISLWLDPDLGASGDDLIACDTLNNTVFCYNATNQDDKYSGAIPPIVPAIGFRMLEGPIVPSPGHIATVNGKPVFNHRNLDLYSAVVYVNGTDPDNYRESYQYMHGLKAKEGGAPYTDYLGRVTRFWYVSDPVWGVGDLDPNPDDKRAMATTGPIDFRPGDTQQVVFLMAVGQGGDYLSSVNVMKAYLDWMQFPTSVDDEGPSLLPSAFAVHQNYPNPFNPATTFCYALPTRSEVEVAIFNVLGRRVATLVRETQSAGEHTVIWNGTDDMRRAVASGVYFYRVRAGDDVQSRKMMLLK